MRTPRTARDICPAADSRQGLRRAPGGPVGAGPHERFRNTTVCTGRDHPSRQHTGPAGRPGGNTRSAFRPSPCRATPVTLRSEARLRTATRNACSASQATQNADYGRPALVSARRMSASKSSSSARVLAAGRMPSPHARKRHGWRPPPLSRCGWTLVELSLAAGGRSRCLEEVSRLGCLCGGHPSPFEAGRTSSWRWWRAVAVV